MSKICQAIIALTILLLVISPNPASIKAITNSTPKAYWIYFNGKNPDLRIMPQKRAVNRRSQRGTADNSAFLDCQVDSIYISALRAAGLKVRMTSRWLNAVSAELGKQDISILQNFPFVREIRPVSSYYSIKPVIDTKETIESFLPVDFDYGQSYSQIAMLAIDSLHNSGYNGSDILIGIMDTGFDYNHSSLTRMVQENRLVATHDFINGDDDVMDQDDSQRFHGTAVLSLLAGFEESQLIGSAYGASFILAKTEILLGETEAEEDYWIAAAEWMESLGVDIISSSLGYIDWYDTTQLDGNTAAITQAADIAASLGVIVVNAAGNEGDNPAWRMVTPPADGDSVIAVGSVDSQGNLAASSSRGPTADGRIKPDFCAMGISDYMAAYSGGYTYGNGTSYSAPLIAGGIALLLDHNPAYRLNDILSGLKFSASRGGNPDNNYGWGIPDFVMAMSYLENGPPISNYKIEIYPSPARGRVRIIIQNTDKIPHYVTIHDLTGIEIWQQNTFPFSEDDTEISWNGENAAGQAVASGIYICMVDFGDKTIIKKFCYLRE